jgi:hypothetical protein
MKFVYVWKNRAQKFLDNPKALIPFLKKRLYYNRIADEQIPLYKDWKYYDYKDTLNHIIDNNISIVRFGDELFDMLQGIGLYFNNWRQRYDKRLADRLKEVISSHDPKLLVCFNPELILKTKEEFQKENIGEQWHFWTNSKIFLKDYYHKDVMYGSALCFNPLYNKHIDYLKLKNFFASKHIIILTSNTERFRTINLGVTTTLLEAPASDSWQQYERIKKELLALIEKNNFQNNNTLILVSMGSAAKVLVYDLTKLGYTAWDTGQFFDLAWSEIKKLV